MAKRISPALARVNKKRSTEVAIRDERVMAMFREGMTHAQIGAQLKVEGISGTSRPTIALSLKRSLALLAESTILSTDEYRAKELEFIDQQISDMMADVRHGPEVDPDTGEWAIDPMQAAKIRNMARITLNKWRKDRARLLGLEVKRIAVEVNKREAIVRVNMDVGALLPKGDEPVIIEGEIVGEEA